MTLSDSSNQIVKPVALSSSYENTGLKVRAYVVQEPDQIVLQPVDYPVWFFGVCDTCGWSVRGIASTPVVLMKTTRNNPRVIFQAARLDQVFVNTTFENDSFFGSNSPYVSHAFGGNAMYPGHGSIPSSGGSFGSSSPYTSPSFGGNAMYSGHGSISGTRGSSSPTTLSSSGPFIRRALSQASNGTAKNQTNGSLTTNSPDQHSPQQGRTSHKPRNHTSSVPNSHYPSNHFKSSGMMHNLQDSPCSARTRYYAPNSIHSMNTHDNGIQYLSKTSSQMQMMNYYGYHNSVGSKEQCYYYNVTAI